MAGIETESCLQNDNNGPPALSINIPKLSEVKAVTKVWEDVQLQVDILLLVVKDCDFLCCYCYLRNVFRSYIRGLPYVYFGEVGEGTGRKLKIALTMCAQGGGEVGGTVIVLPKAFEILRPKAVFCVGSCAALHRDKTKLGDVVISAKLTTYAPQKVTTNGVEKLGYSTPVSRDISHLITTAAFGWQPPLKDPEVREVKVHSSGEFLSGPEQVESPRRRDELVSLYPNALAIEMDGDGKFRCIILPSQKGSSLCSDILGPQLEQIKEERILYTVHRAERRYSYNRFKKVCLIVAINFMPHSHQGLNTFKSCLVKHSLNFFSFIKSCFQIFVDFRFSTNESEVKVYLNPMSKLMVQLSIFILLNLV